MSATEDVKYQLSTMRRRVGESDEDFARMLFSMQMEVYSANAGYDLVDDDFNFNTIDSETRAKWIESAKNHPQKHGYTPS